MKNPNKERKKLLERFKPDVIRPIKGLQSLTPEEQERVFQDIMALTTYEFKLTKSGVDTSLLVSLSMRELNDSFFLNETSESHLKLSDKDPMLEKPSSVQLSDFMTRVVAAQARHGRLNKFMSLKMQAAQLYYAFVEKPNAIELDAIRDVAKANFNVFIELNKEQFIGKDGADKLMAFMMSPIQAVEMSNGGAE